LREIGDSGSQIYSTSLASGGLKESVSNIIMKFKKNFHLANKWKIGKVVGMIENYPKQYATPKYLLFIKAILEAGWSVKVYVVRVSKYVFIYKEEQIFKIRFSNHKPLYEKEMEDDCDYYVGVSHTQVSTTEELLKKLIPQ
jgi:hypothetical protein